MYDVTDRLRTDAHLGVRIGDVRAAGAVGGAGARQGGARHVENIFGVGPLEVLPFLETQLGARGHDSPAGYPSGGGRQASDIYRAGDDRVADTRQEMDG